MRRPRGRFGSLSNMSTFTCFHCHQAFPIDQRPQTTGLHFCSVRCCKEYHDPEFQRNFVSSGKLSEAVLPSPAQPKRVGMLGH